MTDGAKDNKLQSSYYFWETVGKKKYKIYEEI